MIIFFLLLVFLSFLNYLTLLFVRLNQAYGSSFKILNLSVRFMLLFQFIRQLLSLIIRNTKSIHLELVSFWFLGLNHNWFGIHHFLAFRATEVRNNFFITLIRLYWAFKTWLCEWVFIFAKTAIVLSDIWVVNELLNLELIVPDTITLRMLGVIENIICWLDYASMNLLSLRHLGLLWFWHNLLLFEDFINFLKRTFVIAVSWHKLLFPRGFKATANLHGASPNISSFSTPSWHLLQFVQFLTRLLRSNLQIDLLPIVSMKILGGDLIIMGLSYLIVIFNRILGIILFAPLGGRTNDAYIVISVEINLTRLHFLLFFQFLAEPGRTHTACLGILVANDEQHLLFTRCITQWWSLFVQGPSYNKISSILYLVDARLVLVVVFAVEAEAIQVFIFY